MQKKERRYREQKRGMGKTLKGKFLFSETFFLPPENVFLQPCAGSYLPSSAWPFLLTVTSFPVNFPVKHISFLHPTPLFTPIPFSPPFLPLLLGSFPVWLNSRKFIALNIRKILFDSLDMRSSETDCLRRW